MRKVFIIISLLIGSILSVLVLIWFASVLVTAGYFAYMAIAPSGFETCKKNGGRVFETDNPKAGSEECYLKGKSYNSYDGWNTTYTPSIDEACLFSGLDPKREGECRSLGYSTKESYQKVNDCNVNGLEKISNSSKTVCGTTTMSGDDIKRLLVLDYLPSNHFMVRILESEANPKELHREEISKDEMFKDYYLSGDGSLDIDLAYEKEDVSTKDGSTETKLGDLVVLFDNDDIPRGVGLPMRNADKYRFIWTK